MLTHHTPSMGSLHRFAPPARLRATPPRDAGIRVACDPAAHHICVIGGDGELLEAFGQFGRLPGEFSHPSDVVVVSPRFDGEDAPDRLDLRLDLIVVADRGNDRLQVFEPEGQLVAIIGGPDGRDAADVDGREGWPFFRLGPQIALRDPARLRWEDPWLVVIDGDGGETRLDLALALLPTFDEWIATASTPMLASAHHHFRHKTRNGALAEALATIETALGVAWLNAGDVDAASRLWSLGWAPQLATAVRDRQAAQRDHAAMRAAFRLGGVSAVSRVRAAIRLSLGVFAAWPGVDRDRATREAS